MLKSKSYDFLISYQETDAAGVVYYANYLSLCEKARFYWLSDHGIDIAAMHKQDIVFPVREVQIKYKKSIELGNTVRISCTLLQKDKYSMLLEHRFEDPDTKELYAQASMKIVCFADHKLSKLSDHLP